MNPVKYIFDKCDLNGRLARCTLMLSEFGLKYVPLKVIKGQAVAEFFADNPIYDTQVIDTWSFPDEDLLHTDTESWDFYFDGALNLRGYDIRVLLISHVGEHTPISVKLDFEITRSWKIRSKSLALYKARIDQVAQFFDQVIYLYLPREENQFADTLAKVASLINMPDNMIEMSLCIEQWSEPAYVHFLTDENENQEEPWYQSILNYKLNGTYPPDMDKRGQ
ncbi:uncharacterized protein LOC141617415 [Silene latifolia]|uniref:uncharacterized protein LOC141617415 n=1 Tax=Silene latifolia TaxID=37657 RepID=UPI003D78A180